MNLVSYAKIWSSLLWLLVFPIEQIIPKMDYKKQKEKITTLGLKP